MRLSNLAKRAFDIFVSFFALILLSPLFGILALAIKRDSPGPVFFRGTRVGRRGKPFKILKFRTMYETPKSYQGPKVTAQDDPRITKLGHWLRDTKLNELPQYWNVLVGEMSMVGPRPEDPSLAKTWPTGIRDEILSVRPGITSPASILYHNEESMMLYGDILRQYLHEITPDKMRLDQLYVRYRSFMLDLDVLIWTSLILIPQVRAFEIPENLLFVGPVSHLLRRYLNWFTIDFFVTLAAIGITGLIWRAFGPLDVGWVPSLLLALGFALLFSLTGYIWGANRITWVRANYQDVYDLLPGWLVATIVASVVCYTTEILPLGLILIASLLALGGFALVRYRSRLVTGFLSRIVRRQAQTMVIRERVLIVGSGRTAEHIAWFLGHPAYAHKFEVVGFAIDDLMSLGMRMYGSKIIGTTSQIRQLVENHDIGIIILADHSMDERECCSIIDACQGMLTKVVVIPDLFGSLDGLLGCQSENQGQADQKKLTDFRCDNCLVTFASRSGSVSEDSTPAFEAQT
jgi:lipopolysaccharide/colanic/teichoic acid biosynthesis glycosyltransferase